MLTDINATALDGVIAELGERFAMGVVADVTDLAAMRGAVAAGVERFGGLDAVVANAGITNYGTVLNGDPSGFHRLFDVNLGGVYNSVHAALPPIVERKGYVLIVSSEAAFVAAPGMAAYTASKAAVENFAGALRLEVAHLGVAVGSAHMSWIDTPLVREVTSDVPVTAQMISEMPWPLDRMTSVEKCGKDFARGIEKRRRRVYVPGWVRVLRVAKPFLQSKTGERLIGKGAADYVSTLDTQIATLGRSMQAHILDAETPE